MNKKYNYGDRLILIKPQRGKPDIAFVVSDDEDYLIKLSAKFPYVPGDPHFFVNVAAIENNWRHEKDGVQLTLFKGIPGKMPSKKRAKSVRRNNFKF